MAPLLHHRPPLLLLAILVAACHGAADSYDTSMCVPQPYNCGDVNISYPFYSKTQDLLGNNGAYCGYPGLQIYCEDGKASLELGSGNYTVSHIEYEPPKVSLALHVVGEDSCPGVDGNVTLGDDSSSWLKYPNDTVDYLLFFINCNFVTVQGPSNTSSTTCKFKDGQAAGLYFVFRKEDVPYQGTNWWKDCQQVVEVPVLNSSLPPDPINYDTAWMNGGYGTSLRAGFELTWEQERKPQECSQCEKSAGQCGYNKAGGYVACLCSGGRVGAPNCANTTAANSSGKPLSKSKLFQINYSRDGLPVIVVRH